MDPLLSRPKDRSIVVPSIAKMVGGASGRFIGLFCGAADVFFASEPSRGVLVDARKPYVAFYEAIQREPDAVFEELQKLLKLSFSERTFNQIRSKWNGKDFGVVFAAKFLYLNRVCADGSFSVDQGQRFTATWGELYKLPSFPSLDDMKRASAALKRVRLYTKDYALVLRAARKGDVVYADAPPWGTGIAYGGSVFTESDHVRLARLLRKASERGVTVLVSNADCEGIQALYGSWADTEAFDGDQVVVSAVGSFMDRKQMNLFG
jgi:DNA adenine methylase